MLRTRVVLVDDHTLFRKSLRSLLEQNEAVEVVGEADGAATALEALAEVTPDVVLMDISLGEGEPDGVEATRRIRELYPHLPVLMLTMYDSFEVVTETARAGAAGYVLKDAQPDDLVKAITAVARGDGWLSPSVARKAMEELAHAPAMAQPSAPPRDPVAEYQLTPREREIIQLLVDGCTYQEMATELEIGASAVKQFVATIYEKLGARSKSHAAAIAIAEGLAASSR